MLPARRRRRTLRTMAPVVTTTVKSRRHLYGAHRAIATASRAEIEVTLLRGQLLPPRPNLAVGVARVALLPGESRKLGGRSHAAVGGAEVPS